MACRAALARFRRRLAQGRTSTRPRCAGSCKRNAASEFGRRHDFAGLARATDVEAAYAGALPVATYDDFREPFERMANGATDVMFPGRPRLFVSTSGTTGDPKLFPVTSRQQNAALLFIALLTPAARAACTPGLGFRQPTATLMVASRPGRQTAAGHSGGQSERRRHPPDSQARAAVLGVSRRSADRAGLPDGALPARPVRAAGPGPRLHRGHLLQPHRELDGPDRAARRGPGAGHRQRRSRQRPRPDRGRARDADRRCCHRRPSGPGSWSRNWPGIPRAA